MMAAVLPIDGAVDMQAIVRRLQQGVPPADVQEYLWRVRIEAEGIPDVVVSDVDPRQFDAKQTANMPAIPSFADTVDAALLPSEQWKTDLLADFAELRQLIVRWQELGVPETELEDELEGGTHAEDDNMVHGFARAGSIGAQAQRTAVLRTDVPRMSDIDGWHTFFFGKPETQLVGTPPHLRLLLQFDQVLTRRLLEHHAEWLEDEQALSRARGVWIYALLARLDKPVHAGVAATIRQLLRRCWQLRSELQLDASTAVATTASLELKALNVLICITGDFFGQLHEQEP